MLDKPFVVLFDKDRNEFRAINLLQVASVKLADKMLTLQMSNGDTFNFSHRETKLDLLKLLTGLAVLPDGSSADAFRQQILAIGSSESLLHDAKQAQ